MNYEFHADGTPVSGNTRLRYRGAFAFTHEHLREKLGITGEIYGIEMRPASDDVVFWCRHAQDEIVVPEGSISPILTKNGVRQ